MLFRSREIGKFILAGKSKPVTIYELICHIEDSTQKQKDFCYVFSRALEAYAKQSWEEAAGKFKKAITIIPADGPSSFYLEQCSKLKSDPPGDGWKGYVRIDSK